MRQWGSIMKIFRSILSLFFVFTTLSLHGLNTELFYKKLREPIPEWMSEQIQQDLAPFQKQLSQKYLDQLFAKDEFLQVRVRVKNGNISIEKSRSAEKHGAADSIIPHFMGLHHVMPLPDMDFIFSAADGIGCHPKGPAYPILTISKCRQDAGVILMPDWFALNGYEPDKAKVLEGNRAYPWPKKIEKIFFRGGDTGIQDGRSFETWKKSIRPKLVAFSLKYPSLVDARFAITLHNKQFVEDAKREGYIGNYVQLKDYIQFKYLIDLDGNCASAPRLALLLYSNSVTFKHITDSMQWFYKALKPNVHFIPLKEDLSDLFTQLHWAKTHDADCQIISENARRLASEVLSREMVYLYLYRLLEEYAMKQQDYYLN